MRKRLGEVLVAEGVISGDQLQSALAEAARWGRRVGQVLLARGDCTEAQILEALAAQLEVQAAPLELTTPPSPRLLKLIPAELARDRLVVPVVLDVASGVLQVAMADPADYELLDELRFRTGHEIRPMVALASDVAEAVERFYFESPPGAEAKSGDEQGEGDLEARVDELGSRLDAALVMLEEMNATQEALIALLKEAGLLETLEE